MYDIKWRILDCQDHGLPQCRRRAFIVGLRKSFTHRPLKWPKKIPLKYTSKELLGKPNKKAAFPAGIGQATRLLEAMSKIRADQNKYGKLSSGCFFIDIDSVTVAIKKDVCPCITRSRAGSGGFWVPHLKRRMGSKALAQFQGIPLEDLNTRTISQRQLRLMIGNAWAINVASRVIKQILFALGMATQGDISGPWAS